MGFRDRIRTYSRGRSSSHFLVLTLTLTYGPLPPNLAEPIILNLS
jgi:hypothetical protein